VVFENMQNDVGIEVQILDEGGAAKDRF